MRAPDLTILTDGLGGLSGNGLSQYGTSQVTIYDTRLQMYYDHLVEGGFVIKKKHLLEENPGLAWDAPLVGLELAAPSPCPVPDACLAAGLGGAFQALAAKKIASPKWSGLDRVPLADFLQYWREAGAIIGKRVGDHVEFEDGTSEMIRKVNW